MCILSKTIIESGCFAIAISPIPSLKSNALSFVSSFNQSYLGPNRISRVFRRMYPDLLSSREASVKVNKEGEVSSSTLPKVLI